MRGKLQLGAAFLLGGTFLSGAASAQCPTVGNDTGCGAVITITATAPPTVMQTGMGPYDGSDDTLVGVVNNIPACTGGNSTSACGLPIYSIDLTSTKNIFAFDGDGINSFGVQGNAKDNTGYGGPNAYFTNINSAGTSGRVNFITPIAPGGGTGYFSLENVLTASSACTNILNNSVPKPATPAPGDDTVTTFTPQGNDPSTSQPWTLSAAAQACGFFAWDWQQTVTNLPLPTPGNLFHAVGSPTDSVPPFNDPPPTGWAYQLPSPPKSLDAPRLAVYWDPFNSPNAGPYALSAETTATQLFFGDAPADICLPGAQSPATAVLADRTKANGGCGGPGVRAPAGSTINFTTHLVGLQGQLPGAAVVDTGIGFSWTSSYNGTSGGNAALANTQQADPGSGTGGITVTGYTATTTYNGVNVSAVNGSSSGPSSLLAAVLPASRSVQVNATATAFATIINTGTTTGSACNISQLGLPLTFAYQTTNPATNAVTGTINTPVDILAGASQSFVIALTPTATIAPTNAQFFFACSNANPAPVVVGLNTLLLSGSTNPTPDIVALVATTTNDGILHIPGASGTGAFATATVNVGVSGAITASTNTGSATLPLALTICQTNASGQCLATPAATVTTTINANATPTFAIFGKASGTIPFDPANSRIFVAFTDSGNAVRGETSVAVQTQ
jgi:hypothetical protein